MIHINYCTKILFLHIKHIRPVIKYIYNYVETYKVVSNKVFLQCKYWDLVPTEVYLSEYTKNLLRNRQ